MKCSSSVAQDIRKIVTMIKDADGKLPRADGEQRSSAIVARPPRLSRGTLAWAGFFVALIMLVSSCKKEEKGRTDTERETAHRPQVVPPPAPEGGTGPKPEVSVPEPEQPAEELPADFVNYKETVEGRDGTVVSFDMIAVPGGTFTMGSPNSEKDRKKDEGPQHQVTVGPFWIGKTEVTWDEYEAFGVPYGPKGSPWEEEYVDGVTCPTMPWGDPYRGFERDGKPVIGVSWYGGMVYCMWLSRRAGKMYRLPTEAEWEYACRAGAKGMYCFGDDPSQLGEYAWFKDNSEEKTQKIATKKPNAWGIYDMHGNVAEWCLDWYDSDYYASVSSGKLSRDPQGPEKGQNHVFRGGSWKGEADGVRSARRDRSSAWWLKLDPQEPKSHWWFVPTDFIGFRVVRPLHGEEPPFPAMCDGL